MNAKIHCYLTCVILFMFFFGCTPISSVQPTISPTQLPIISSSPATVPSPTNTILPAITPSLHFFYPNVEKRCPENREVSVDNLGIGIDSRIILTDLNKTGLWSIDSVNLSPQLIQELPLDKWINISIDPGGRMLAYTIWNPDYSSSTWVYTIQSDEQHEIMKIDYLEGASSSARWLSQNELIIVGSCPGSGCPFPLGVIDISTGDVLDVSKTVKDPYDTYLGFFEDNGKYYSLYTAGNVGDDYTGFYIYDYLADQKVQVFPWLVDRVFFYPYIGTNLGMVFDLNQVAILVEQSYGFDIGVFEKSVEMLTQTESYDVLMKRVFAATGTHFDRLRFFPVGLDSVTDTLFLYMSYRDYLDSPTNNIAEVKVNDVEDAFFTLDFQDVIKADTIDYLLFTDYCFTATEGYFVSASPDGLIAVFVSDQNIVLMNLETGNISRLSGWSFFGWAK